MKCKVYQVTWECSQDIYVAACNNKVSANLMIFTQSKKAMEILPILHFFVSDFVASWGNLLP